MSGVRFRIQPGLIDTADRTLIRNVHENLLGNAWKFSACQARTEISFGCTMGDKQEAVFFVRDNGAGFDMQYYEKLFGPFERLHSPAEFAGTGIGLTTVQRIVLRHGGTVWAESTPGKGANFYFTLGITRL